MVDQTESSIWLSDDPEAAEKYPHYSETMSRLVSVLYQAELQGVTGLEIASMMASLHASAIARLRPNEQQREHVIGVFREALITCQADIERGAEGLPGSGPWSERG